MAMVASVMANTIKTEMDNVTAGNINPEDANPVDYANAFDSSISAYIQDNCIINYSWAATLPTTPFTPDPVISFTASVSFPSFSIGNAPDINAWALLLQSAIMGAIITPDIYVPPFILPSMAFLLTNPLTLTQSGETEYLASLTSVCNEIVSWIKTLINPTPVPGTHTPYTLPVPGAIMTTIL